MIQDFANVFVVGKQTVRFKTVPIRDNVLGKKIIGGILTAAVMAGIAASLVFCLLIRAGLNDLEAQTTAKAGIIKMQNGLLAKREALLDQKTFSRSAEKLGLFLPENHQVRHL
jgi:hypothetical protein